MAKEEEYEHFIRFSQFWGWAILIGVSVLFIGFGMFAMFTIKDPPRAWDFGTGPDTPGLSIYTTVTPDYYGNLNPTEVIAPLPEKVPWNRNRSNAPTAGTVAPPSGNGLIPYSPERPSRSSPLPGGSE